MKILVCISTVPDTTSKINITADAQHFDATGVQFIINPSDELALSKALSFQDIATTIDVIGVGNASIEPVLRKAMAIGAQHAIRIDAEEFDAQWVAQQIAQVVKNENYDLVFAGRESIDYNGGIVPALLAAELNYHYIGSCTSLTINNQELTAERDVDGVKEKVTTTLPVVIAGQKGLVDEKDIKIPNMRGIMAARTQPITVVTPTDNTAYTQVVSYEKTPIKAGVKMFDMNTLDELIDELGI